MFYDLVDITTRVSYPNLVIDHPRLGDTLYFKKKYYTVVVILKTANKVDEGSSDTKLYIKPSSDEILKIVE